MLSCSRDQDILSNCDDVTFVKDNYVSGVISGLMYTNTDTIWQHRNYCDAQLDSLLLILPYDTQNADSMHHFRYIFLNHNH